MKLAVIVSFFLFPFIAFSQVKAVVSKEKIVPVGKVVSDFKTLLQRPLVDSKPTFQSSANDSIIVERGFIYTEENEKMPILIYIPAKPKSKSFPVVICLHGTGGSKDDGSIKDLLTGLCKIGIMGVAIDARYHGERIKGGANKSQQYNDAIIKAWKNSDPNYQQHPFLFDTVYDLWRLTDYLITRPDVDVKRIGMTGISMGGIETWMAASVDKRIKVAVPIIAAQSFKWSLQNNKWQGRARTIWSVHEQVAKDLGDTSVNKENVKIFWDKLLPGITEEFDCPSMIRLFAPRPLLLLNNEKDLNCPIEGAKVAFEAVTEAYKAKNALDKLAINVTPNEPHKFLQKHFSMTIAWFKKWL